MGKGEVWFSEESHHLAEAWLDVLEDVGSPEVKGTNQTKDKFWNKVVVPFVD